MKTTNKLKPALLENTSIQKVYIIKIDLSNGRWAKLQFSEKEFAVIEYNRIRSLGIYCSAWVNSIILEEIENEIMA